MHNQSPHHSRDKFEFGNFQIIMLKENNYGMKCPTPIMRWPVNSFFYLCSGEVMVYVDEEPVLLKANEAILIPEKHPFSIKYYNDSVGFMGGFSSNYMIDISQNVSDNYNFIRFFNVVKFKIEPQNSERIKFLMQTIYDISHSSDTNSILLKSYLLCFLAELNSNYDCPIDLKMRNVVSYRFLELLFNSSNKGLKAKDYAQMLNVSPNHLNKMVKKATTKAVSTWIDESLIFEAKVLIRNTNLSMGEIAEQLGVFDQSYFARKFKSFESISPSEYRNLISEAHTSQHQHPHHAPHGHPHGHPHADNNPPHSKHPHHIKIQDD